MLTHGLVFYRKNTTQPALPAVPAPPLCLVPGASIRFSKAGGGSSSNVSLRAPAETMVFMVVSQLQFLATLSMVDSTVDDDSFLSEFVTNLRYPIKTTHQFRYQPMSVRNQNALYSTMPAQLTDRWKHTHTHTS